MLQSVRRAGAFAATLVALLLTQAAGADGVNDNTWVLPSETTLDSSQAVEAISQGTADNLCEGINGIPTGGDPGWVRVGGSPLPWTPFVEVSGQVLPDFDHKTNPFVTHTDAPFTHYAHDLNVFVTLDPEDRGILASGNFEEGESNERGEIEVEWERGGIPMYAWPSPHDRITIWGPHVWDCGHGEPESFVEPDGGFSPDDPGWLGVTDAHYRTEIHPPVGWVVYRNTANTEDRNGNPRPEKRTQSPWVWYEFDDHQGTGAVLGTGGLLDTPVQATVADAFFSTFGGNVPEALNGCEDSTFVSSDTSDATCYYAISDDSFEWAQPLLQQDYTFFVPAPPKPTPDATMVWSWEDRCAQVPSDPGNPPGDNVEDVTEADDTAENIGAPTCNTIPEEIEATTNSHGQPGIQVTLRAASGGVSYPGNEYLAFAKRYKVAWDWIPPGANRIRTYEVHIESLRVYDDTEDCGNDGEWVVSLRVNEKWVHPVAGVGDGGLAFWENGALDDAKCGDDGDYLEYTVNEFFRVSPGPGQPVRVWMRGWDDDTTFIQDNDVNEVLPLINVYHGDLPGGPQPFVAGIADEDVEGAHTIVYTITDVSDPQPIACCLEIGAPRYDEATDTGGRVRVNGTLTPLTVHPLFEGAIDGDEWRIWREGEEPPGTWNFDLDDTDGLAIDLPNGESATGNYVLEWATILTTDGRQLVAPRERESIQLDNTPPELVLPADFSVFATQTEGAFVTFDVTVSDNFPGPVTYDCDHHSGDLFPNGKNAPLTTTVTCTATDAVLNQTTDSFDVTVISPFGYIPDYVVLAREWVALGSGTIVNGAPVDLANVGAFDASPGVPSNAGFEVVAGPAAQFLGGSQIAAHSDRIEASSLAGDVFYVDQYTSGNGAVFTPKVGYVPLWFNMPAVPAFSAGGPGVSLAGTQSLGPGTYGDLTVKPNAVVTLTGGTYDFTAIEVKPGAQVRVAGPTTIRVTGRVLLSNVVFGPSPGGPVQPHEIVLYATGEDGPPGKPADAIGIGTFAVVGINAYATNGTLSLGSFTAGTGAFLGQRVKVAGSVTLSEDSVFVQP